MSLISQTEFAKLKNVSRAAVSQWKNEGRLKMVGKLIDLEATDAELVRGSSWRSKRHVPARTQEVKLATKRSEATVMFPAPGLGLPDLVMTISIFAQFAGLDAAEGILRHVADEPLARAVADDVSERAIRAAAEMLEEDMDPPVGCATWADHPIFKDAPEHCCPVKWAEMVRDAEAWRAKHGRGETAQ